MQLPERVNVTEDLLYGITETSSISPLGGDAKTTDSVRG